VASAGSGEFINSANTRVVTTCPSGEFLSLSRQKCVSSYDSANVEVQTITYMGNNLNILVCKSATKYILASGSNCAAQCDPISSVPYYRSFIKASVPAPNTPLDACVASCPAGYVLDLLKEKCILIADCETAFGANVGGSCVCSDSTKRLINLDGTLCVSAPGTGEFVDSANTRVVNGCPVGEYLSLNR